MRILLDTNAWSAMQTGSPAVEKLVRRAEGVVMSAVVVGELLYGFRNGGRFRRNMELLDDFLAEPQVAFLPVTRATCERFGIVAFGLRRSGRPLPTNDVWIAAHAIESGSVLISFDSDFDAVQGLDLIRP
ncbi:MAG: type II toxin-antitoxin system VapC family toxin [Planctomycetes bacterium]|nr:type II toxin-antitoxin system VapC family toxin [Planctomycetota bacterium]